MNEEAAGALDLCDPGVLRALLGPAGFSFSKAKGQNFLIAPEVPERVADACGADEGTGVVEIGPGVGCLTAALARRAGRVLALELDERLRPVLRRTLAPFPNTEVVFGDVMRCDLRREAEARLPGLRRVLCANLPYNITTPVLTRVYEAGCFASVTVMVQREVALRICAAPGSGDYGAFTLLTRWYGVPALLFPVGAECFVPRPKVESAVVRIDMRPSPPVDAPYDAVFRLVRAAFGQRRKTLVNALEPVCGRDRARAALESCGFDPRVRGEELSLADFARLARVLEAQAGEGSS